MRLRGKEENTEKLLVVNLKNTVFYLPIMTSMLRPMWSANSSFVSQTRRVLHNARSSSRLMATQSSGDTEPPTALATLYLEDGTKLTGKSFGCHESVEGEVSESFYNLFSHKIVHQKLNISFILLS